MEKTDIPRLILASQSPRRKEILEQLNLDFEVISPGEVELEPEVNISPDKYVISQATIKAYAVADKLRVQNAKAIIIGCDTVAVLNNKIIGKPKFPEDAKNILRKLSGTKHRVISGLCIIKMPEGTERAASETTELRMKKMSETEIEDYVNSGEALGKAGAYAIQETGDKFVSVVKGSVANVAGFPVDTFIKILKDFGIDIQQ